MSILIKGMEMPKRGEFSHVRIYDNGEVTIESNGVEYPVAKAVVVPDHGDLIDRDMVLKKAWDVETFVDAVKYAPVIIPVDKESGE